MSAPGGVGAIDSPADSLGHHTSAHGADGIIAPFVTRSSSPHAADWGRAIARALEDLTARIVLRDGVDEAAALVGRTVTLRVDPVADGVEIVVELVAGSR